MILNGVAFFIIHKTWIRVLKISGEMLDFIREGRSRSVVALKREAGKERERIVEKLRNRSRQRHSENVIPPLLSGFNNR